MSNDNEKITRKLRAILSADVKGYSLLMADDEIHTIETLKKYRSLMSGLIQQHSGRVVDNPGDNLLAEFSSAVFAMEMVRSVFSDYPGLNLIFYGLFLIVIMIY
jgi:adenylate cyclase